MVNLRPLQLTRTATTYVKWDPYFHVGTTRMRDRELWTTGMYTLTSDIFSDSGISSLQVRQKQLPRVSFSTICAESLGGLIFSGTEFAGRCSL